MTLRIPESGTAAQVPDGQVALNVALRPNELFFVTSPAFE
jgi:hypothetical protein